MEEIEIADVVTRVVEKLVPVIRDILDKTEQKGLPDDELTIADVVKDYPKASKYLVRKWCHQGLLHNWSASNQSNSKYLFKREDFENVYYSQCRDRR